MCEGETKMNTTNLVKLKQLQEETAALHAQYVANKKVFDETSAPLLDKRNGKDLEIAELKEIISAECLEDYNTIGVKTFQGGLAIRLNNRVNYKPVVALEWAKVNMSAIVKQTLDKRAFEKFAKELDLDFVELTKEPSVTYPAELKI